jgi:hypothetical protein
VTKTPPWRGRVLSEVEDRKRFKPRFLIRSAPPPASQNRTRPPPPERLRRLAAELHSLGERALFEFLLELSHGADPWARLERYAALAPLAPFIAAHDGDRLSPPRIIDGGQR